MIDFAPVRTGTVGLGNYAGLIYNLLLRHSQRPDPPVRLCALSTRRQPKDDPAAKGVKVIATFNELLQQDIEAVYLPLPIDLHRTMTEQALAAGKAVLCEKPAAPTVDDIDAMIAARERSGKPVAIGFQDMYDPLVFQLKKLLLDGAIGPIRHMTHLAAGARGDTYYNRAPWAGKIRHEGQWVLDSPANNAHAHGINLALYLAGQSLHGPAAIRQLEAELYRSNPIENYDTISLRLHLDGGFPLLVLLTHACEFFVDDLLLIEGQRGRIFRTRNVLVIETPAGSQVLRQGRDLRDNMVERFSRLVRGIDDPEITYGTLETARAQVLAINGASQAAPIYAIPDSASRLSKTLMGQCRAVVGMEALINLCARRNVMLHESGLFPWTRPAASLDMSNYQHFAGVAQSAAAAPQPA